MYQKLEQNYCIIQSYHNKVNTLLIHQEEKFKNFYVHYDKSILIVKKFEQDHNNMLTIIEELIIDKAQLLNNVKFLKNVISYLNLEIKKYQDNLKTQYKMIKKETVNVINETKTGFEKIDLLKTYQENVNEKNQLIKKYKNDFIVFTDKFKEVLIENNSLCTEIENIKIKVCKILNIYEY
jgi:predicted hydrocarbon binding protein